MQANSGKYNGKNLGRIIVVPHWGILHDFGDIYGFEVSCN